MAENINRKLNIYINDKEVVNSMGGITRAMAATRNEIRSLNKGAEDYDERLKELKDTYSKLTKEQDNFKKDISGVPSLLKNIKAELGPIASGMLAAFSIGSLVAGAAAALSNAKKIIFDFEQGVADLSAITGATGKDLDFLKNKAIELGIETKGGAVAVLESYQLIASAKPELLENVDALNQVTEATLLLAKASGLELPEAATKLTDAMNQFGVDASQASVFVDALANGAKYGAAEIPQVTEALLKFGAVAKSSNINIQESTALIELLAENGLKGAEAGTSLRNVLLKLSAPDALPKEARIEMQKLGISMEFLKDKTIPIQERLEVLKPLLRDNASIVKVFGTENATAAINVIAHTDRLKDLSSKMYEVGTAQEQAAIKMDTVNNKTELLKSKYESLILSIGKGSGVVSGFFKFFIDGASNALGLLIRMNSSWDELYDKAASKGSKLGKDSFDKQLNSRKRISGDFMTDAEYSKLIKNQAVSELKILRKQEAELNKEIADFNPYAINFGKSGKDMKLEKEQLMLDIAARARIIKEANNKITPAKQKTSINENIGAVGLSDEEKKEAAKQREKELADAKRHSEDLLKQLEASKKELLATERSFDDLKLANQKDGYDKELALLNEEYGRKIEDTKSKVSQLQEEINKLNADAKNPGNSKDDVAVIKATIANKIAAQIDYSASLVDIEKSRIIKIGALQEKYLQKDIQDQEAANARALQNLQTKHNNELSSITTLENAKTVLSSYLSEDELKKVTTLEEAKKKIKQQFQNEELTLQQEHLADLMAQMQILLNGTNEFGISLISPEEREKLLEFMDQFASKFAAIGVQKAEGENQETEKKAPSGIDLLGYSPEQWEEAFNKFDTLEGKLGAVGMAVLGLKNAFGMYFQFLEAGEKRTMQKFEANNRKKQADLNDQLEKGYITQEVYTARKAKLDAELAKKKAEIEYKQAKREKIMNIASIIGNTAVGVSKALAQGGLIAGVPFAAIVAGLGAIQLALAIAQPLPEKGGFYDGGYTGSGPERNSPGPVHYDEYVVPKKVLFSNDPVVPNIMGYLEAKRTGKNPQITQDETNSTQTNKNNSNGSTTDVAVVNALNRNSFILEKIEEDGLPAYLVNDIKTAKKMRDKIKEVNKLESNAKL